MFLVAQCTSLRNLRPQIILMISIDLVAAAKHAHEVHSNVHIQFRIEQ